MKHTKGELTMKNDFIDQKKNNFAELKKDFPKAELIEDVYKIKFLDDFPSTIFLHQLENFVEKDKKQNDGEEGKDFVRLFVDKGNHMFIIGDDSMWNDKHKLNGISALLAGRWAGGCGGVHVISDWDMCFDADNMRIAIDLLENYERNDPKCDKYN